MENLHGWYGKLLSPILVYYLGLPMLESFIPILAYHLCLTTIGWHNTNIGIPFLFHQHWILLYQYWLTIYVWPTLDDSLPILAYHFCLTNVGIYNTLPILVCHSLIPKINQIYANENHIISLHWNLKYFPVSSGKPSLFSSKKISISDLWCKYFRLGFTEFFSK